MAQKTRWQQVEELFLEAADLDAASRYAFLEEHCKGDTELREEVESLLRSSDSAPHFLDAPIMEGAKKIVDQPGGSLAPGTCISHYKVISLLGTGGMGEVYIAQDMALKRKIALKVLPPRLTIHEQALRRFEQEAQAASALNHPNILTIFEFGESNGLCFMASELVEGETLRARLTRGALPVTESLEVAWQVASALAAAHAGGIWHRDIKPENIVIRRDGLVKLLDFGIAKLSEGHEAVRRAGVTLTEAGMVMGTLKYMSPEQARGLRVDGRSDIFSLGAVLYEMIGGKEPFEGETSSDVIAEILKSDPPPLKGEIAARHPSIQRVISKAMCKDREERYQAVAEFAQDLQALKREMEFETISGPAMLRDSKGLSVPLSQRGESAAIVAGSGLSGYGKSVRLSMLIAAMLVAAVFLFFFVRSRNAPSSHEQIRSLAILPFQNLKPDPATDFLGFSLADAVTAKLAYVSSLNIRPSTAVEKFRNQMIDPRKVANELQVDTLLTGNYVKDGDELRISTQLIDLKADKIVWHDVVELKYDKLLEVQDRVSQEIVNGLELHLSPAEADHLKPGAPVDARAYEYYLRGIDFYALSDFAAATEMLEKAVAAQPDYAAAWAELGRAESTRASLHGGGRELYAKAQQAYEKAILLNPSLIEPRIYMGNLFTDTGRVEQGIPLLRAALHTSPNNAEAHWELGYAYRFGGMLAESVSEGERARGFDPQVKINSSAMNGYLYLGQYDQFLQSLPANNSVYILFYRGFGEYHEKQWARAAQDFNHAYELDPTLLPAQVGKALSYALAGQNASGLAILHGTERRIDESGVEDSELVYKVAQAYAVLGDKASALRMFQRAIEGGFFCYPYFVRDPLLDNVRHEPGFEPLLEEARRRHEEFKARFF
jgi:serine/threonine protein kinase/tetratricopeptide (TPR) repeat protein